ncbi:hypothetical protein E4L95_03205 [Paracoccus liaowanqingii]|uniref:Uncharacterized protein n=1 Tax=Paracoccus liaowanqingii TaxID=2560053 RepID=A0A4Z1CSE5_9RHOB|nr:hypothetical protein E4L95_03205 [Paracoccus liaowanqingii]
MATDQTTKLVTNRISSPPVTRELVMTTLLTRRGRAADRDVVLFVSIAYEDIMRSAVLLAERC